MARLLKRLNEKTFTMITTKSMIPIIALSLIHVHLAFGQRYVIHTSNKEAAENVYIADSLFYADQLKESIALYEELRQTKDCSQNLLLNLASMYGRVDDVENSINTLRQLMDSGYINVQHLTNNPDLETLKNEPAWHGIITQCQKNLADLIYNEHIKQPYVMTLILTMANDDQLIQWKSQLKNKHKHAYPNQTLEQIDEEKDEVMRLNVEQLKRIFDNYGYLWEEEIGVDGTHYAWLLVQHADYDLAFQQAYLQQMRLAIDNGKVKANKKDFAYLYDRVQRNLGKPQLYGTQVNYQVITDEDSGEKEVKISPYDVEQPQALNARREEMDLPTWEEYLEKIKQMSGF